MTPHERRLFLESYAAGRHTPAAHRAFAQWLRTASGPELADALAQYEQLAPPPRPAAPDPRLLAKIEARLDRVPQPARPPVAAPARWPRWLAAAAVLVAAAGYWLRPVGPPAGGAAPPLALLRRHVPAGRTDSLALADGSVVVLNGGSTLAYPARFAAGRRDVYLAGEAYFRVAKNPARPFVIHSGALQTRVVGTSFNVYAYPRAARQEVTVLTGKVLVSSTQSGQTVALLPAQRAVLEAGQPRLRAAAVANPALALAWRRGQLQFEDAPLAEVLDKLAVRYGVALRTRRPDRLRCRLTVRFGPESWAQAQRVLAALTHGRFRTDAQRTVWLEGSGEGLGEGPGRAR